MNTEVVEGFEDIELFNKYAQEHASEFAPVMDKVASKEDLVLTANRMGFSISLGQVDAYVRARCGGKPHRHTLGAVTNTVTLTSTCASAYMSTSACIATAVTATATASASAQAVVNTLVIGFAVAAVSVY